MKLFATFILSAMAAASLFAASIPRCDVSGVTREGKIKLVPGKVDGGMWGINQSWGPEETRPCRLSAAASRPIGTKWTLCKFVFTPEASGPVFLSIGGQWA